MLFPLSILDLSLVDAGYTEAQTLQNTLELAQQADQLGYTRYWFAEHHNTSMMVSSTPEIMIAHAVQITKRMRVGSGGVMLLNHAPLKVAETFRVLEALHPGRIDLGVGRASGADANATLALRRSKEFLGVHHFLEQLLELLTFVRTEQEFPFDHPFRSVKAGPGNIPPHALWLLGSSIESAQLAASLGMGFAYAYHLKPGLAIAAIKTYREHFSASHELTQSQVILTVNVICAETDEYVARLEAAMTLSWLRAQAGQPAPLADPAEADAYIYTSEELAKVRNSDGSRGIQIRGQPESVCKDLLKLAQETGTDELMISAMMYGHDNRVRMYALLAEAFDLS